jgi:hypothetical protein
MLMKFGLSNGYEDNVHVNLNNGLLSMMRDPFDTDSDLDQVTYAVIYTTKEYMTELRLYYGDNYEEAGLVFMDNIKKG